jgi:hypothetical protein
MPLIALILACTGQPDDTDTGTADTTEIEGVEVACGLEPIGSESVWGGWLEGVRAPDVGCDGESAEPCALTGGHRVEAEWFNVNPGDEVESYWVAGYEQISNDPDDATRAFVYVEQESPNVGECRITLY